MSVHSAAENIVNESHYLERMERVGVPEHLRDGLVRYLVHRIQPGHFLTAVLGNDLREAVNRGDDDSLAGLVRLVVFLDCHVRNGAWGSPQAVREWLEQR